MWPAAGEVLSLRLGCCKSLQRVWQAVAASGGAGGAVACLGAYPAAHVAVSEVLLLAQGWGLRISPLD